MLRRHADARALPLAWVLLAAGAAAAADQTQQPLTDLHGDPLPAGARARLGTVRYRHACTAAAFSPDGKLLATGGADNHIHLFDAATGKEVRVLAGHQARTYTAPPNPKSPLDTLVNSVGEGRVNALAFSPDGKLLASGGWDDAVRLWDVATGKQARRLEAHRGMVAAVAFAPDGKVLVSRGGLDGTLRLWDPATGKELQAVEGLSGVNPWRFNRSAGLAFSPDGKVLAAGDKGAIRFFDPATGKELPRWEAHLGCLSLAYSADGKLLASGGVDGKDKNSIRIWDVKSGKELRRCQLNKDEPPISLAFAPGRDQLAAAVEEDDLHVFDVATGKPAHRLKHYWPSRVVYSPDGKTLVSTGGAVPRLWDAATGKERAQEFEGHKAGVAAVAVSPDGKTVATAGEDVRLWEAATGKPIRRIEVRGGAAALAFAPDDKVLASAGGDRVVHLWDAATGKQVAELKASKHRLCGVAFSPDGKRLAAGDAQSTVRIWDVAGGQEVRQIDVQSGTEALALAFTPDGKGLACAGAWNDSSFLPRGGINIQGVVWMPKEGYRALLWDAGTGKEVRQFSGLTAKLKSLALSPDGRVLAASAGDGRVALWELATGKELLYILAHPTQADAVFSASPAIAFSPDGKTLASAGSDRTVRVWDARTGKELRQYRVPQGGLTSVAFTPDGKALVTGGTDTTALVWDLTAPPPARPGEPKVILIGD